MSEKMMRSVRANPEVFERLAEIAKDGNIDQGAALEALINAWDVVQARNQIPERAADIEAFDQHLKGIQSAFLRSLELAQSAESRARTESRALLDARDQTISQQAAQIEGMKHAEEEQLSELDRALTRIEELEQEVKRLQMEKEEAVKRDRLADLLESMVQKLDSGALVAAASPAPAKRVRRKKDAVASDEGVDQE